ncbi:hypothetical protein EJ377_03365 [Chryseobacterium arthrosphaerae]|uniref:Uncharacterized protein n=1 Tax=Chryseobacterium arthrosphaerae TaxID=651561 RepID=A0A3S0QI52_9FLAO|nr:hypothetical protein EJ377_03365 [Chryseobacterium arthrosphaerae]
MGLFDFLFKRKKKDHTNEVTFATDSPDEVITAVLPEETTVPSEEETSIISEETIAPISEEGNLFDLEIIEAFKRYHCDPALDVNIQTHDEKGNPVQRMKPMEIFSQNGRTFSQSGTGFHYFTVSGISLNLKSLKTAGD